jgi:hypothetical protein
MKRCPACQRSYPDDKQLFCLEDGATLVTVAADDPLSPHTRPFREARDTTPAATEVMTAPIGNLPVTEVSPGPFSPPSAVAAPPATRPAYQPAPVPAAATTPPKTRAGLVLGVVALLLALLSLTLMVAGFAGVASEAYTDLGAGLIIITMFLSLLGTTVGLVGIVRAVRNASSRVWPMLGFVANVLYLLFILGLLVLGIAVGK